MCIEETQQQEVTSKVSSRGRKRTLTDEATEKPEKKLTHRIRQKRMKEVKTLLETHDKIVPMKLSVTHLRLLQEIRERVPFLNAMICSSLAYSRRKKRSESVFR